MSVGALGQRIDVGKLLVLPIFTVFMAATANRSIQLAQQLVLTSPPSILEFVRGLLLVAFYLLLIALYLIRRRARASSRSVAANVAALTATFLPVPLSLLALPSQHPALLTAGSLLMLLGLGWSLWALATLGRNISIIAQVRELARTGPYAAVRHPLYLGEIVTALGVVVSGFSWLAATLWVVFASLQAQRAVHEEALLSKVFPEYEEYSRVTARFIPQVF